MPKVILVLDSEMNPQGLDFHKGYLENPSGYTIICTGTEEDRRLALAAKVAPGDEILAYRFIKNDEGVAVGNHYAWLLCEHGVDKLLVKRLMRANPSDKLYDIIANLARSLNELSRRAG